MTSALLTLRIRAAVISVVVGLLMLLLKMSGYLLTGSTAILSDALESVVHVAATAFALLSVILAARPPDKSHPYGHGKIEFFSAGFEGGLIILAALAIIYQAARGLLLGLELAAIDIGVLIVAVAGAVNLVLGFYLIRTGRRTRSLTLVADGKHVLTDSYTSIGVCVGLLLVLATGWTPLDPIVALAVAANILWAGGQLVFQSVRGLMDAADPEQLERVVSTLEEHRRPGWIDVHRLRRLDLGEEQHLDLHLTVPRFWDVERAHAEQEDLERVVGAHLEGRLSLIAHVDPCVDACCPFCSYEPCPMRAAAFTELRKWNVPHAIAVADYVPAGKKD